MTTTYRVEAEPIEGGYLPALARYDDNRLVARTVFYTVTYDNPFAAISAAERLYRKRLQQKATARELQPV